MKKIIFIMCVLITSFQLFTQEIISLSEGQQILQIGMINDSTTVYVIEESTQGLISTIKTYYVITGKEKAGPYDNCFDLVYSPDGKTLAYKALIDNDVYSFVLINGHQYLGSESFKIVVA